MFAKCINVNKNRKQFFNCNGISQYDCILFYIKVTSVSIRDFFQNGSVYTVKLPLMVTSILTVNMFKIKMLQTTVSDLFKCHLSHSLPFGPGHPEFPLSPLSPEGP